MSLKSEAEALAAKIDDVYNAGYEKGAAEGGGFTDEELTFSNNLSYMLSYDKWNFFIDKFGELMKFQNVTDATGMFYSNKIEDLSKLEINVNKPALTECFYSCNSLKKLPKFVGEVRSAFSRAFNSCANISGEEINKFFENIYSVSWGTDYVYSLFAYCYSIRDITYTLNWFHENINKYTGTGNAFIFQEWFKSLFAVNDLIGLPVQHSTTGAKTTNAFGSTFESDYRAKDIVFQTDNGTPYVVKWKSQTIDLSLFVGYVNTNFESYILNYSSGITSDKKVSNEETYQALKDDPDWYTLDVAYSRYNHDSAVNTINSLPDTSEYLATAGGTNTIKFKGAAGSATDGGAINTLTEEEIAVATAKGWTVTLV